MQVGGTSMLLVYPKFYFLPITKEVSSKEENLSRKAVENIIAVRFDSNSSANDQQYKKLFDEIDEEFVKEELAHIS